METTGPVKINIMGMELEAWEYKSCVAEIGYGDDWATIYNIESLERRKGHAQELCAIMQKYYESIGKQFASSVALHPGMKAILTKLNIKEYD